MKLNQLLNIENLDRLESECLVGVQKHPTSPLRIYNYTPSAQYSRDAWLNFKGTIEHCRGLIVDSEDTIISRPFPKFWNLNTPFIPESLEHNLPPIMPTITEKLDGSLGIAWEYDGQCGVATRGSFTSPQALWATDWLKMRLSHSTPKDWSHLTLPLAQSYTWLFEIIYPENRIVLNYDFAGLVLLGAIYIETGREIKHELLQSFADSTGFRCVRKIPNKSIKDLVAENKKDEEGYVVTYSRGQYESPLKVKIKFEDYCRIHKIVTGMNPRTVWQLLKEGKYAGIFTSNLPSHFTNWLRSWEKKLTVRFITLRKEVQEIYANRPFQLGLEGGRQYRKRCALYFEAQNRRDLKSAFFALLNGREDISDIIWDGIEPRGDDKSFRTEGE